MIWRLAFARLGRLWPIAGLAAALVGGGVTVSLLQQARELARRTELWPCTVPLPTGPWHIGRTTIALDAMSAGDRRAGSLNAELWYPAEVSDRRPTHQRCLGLTFWRKPEVLVTGSLLVAATGTTLPLLVYLPGWGNRRDDNTFVLAELASHGFVVIALDDIAHDPPAEGGSAPEPVPPFDLGSEASYARSLAVAERRVGRSAARVSQVLDRLAALNASSHGSLLDGHIDLSRIGVIGFSFGGTAAAEALLHDPRLRAGANLDGGHMYGEISKTTIEKPYLALNSDFGDLAEAAQSEDIERRLTARMVIKDREIMRRQSSHPGSAVLLIKKTEHTDFSDRLFATTLASVLKGNARSQATLDRIRAVTDRLLVGFFKRALVDQSKDAAAGTLKARDPEVEMLP